MKRIFLAAAKARSDTVPWHYCSHRSFLVFTFLGYVFSVPDGLTNNFLHMRGLKMVV